MIFTRLLFLARYLNLENIPLPHNNQNKQPGEDILIPGENSQNQESPGSTGLLYVYDLV